MQPSILLVFCVGSLLSVAAGQLLAYNNPYAYLLHSTFLSTPAQQQYHTRDVLGQYSYGYSEPLSSKHETRSLDGVTRCSYSYRDAAGKLQQVDYTADAAGFHVAATNLPQQLPTFRAPTAVTDTVEVAAARKAHLAAHEEARLRLAKAGAIDQQYLAVDADADNVAVRGTLASSAESTAKTGIKDLEKSTILRAGVPVLSPFHTTAVLPNVYSINYPLKSRFVPAGYYY